MRKFKFGIFSILLIIVFVTAAFLPDANALAQDTRGVFTPTTLSPHGTILTTTPRYYWSVVTGATIYRLQVWKGSTLVFDKSTDSAVCGLMTCSKKPAVTLGAYVYKWRVKAYKAGVWSAWSAYMNFTVSPAGFNDQFNEAMSGWARKSGGTWSINSGMYLWTTGIAGKWSSAFKTGRQYTDFDYQARVWHNGLHTTYIAVRMGSSVGTNEQWYPGYIFGYTNDGDFAVFRVNSNNTTTTIQGWTDSTAVIENDWNTLRVVAKGSDFWYYINGTLVKTFTDGTYPRGFVGFQAYRSVGPTQYSFYVDWAKLTPISTVQ